MAKFCKKCGSKLDEASGKCPNCDKVADEKNTSSNNVPEQQKQLSKKEMKAEKKKLKKQAKKDKKKQKRAQLTTKQKVKRFFVKLIAVVLALVIAVSGCACTLVYFDLMDIPFISDVMSKIGIAPKNADTDDFNSISGKFTDILVTDEQSAIAAAQEAALQMGLGNAADELTVNNVSTVGNLTYYRLQQNYQGIPVYGKTMVVVCDNSGVVLNCNSNVQNVKNVDIKESISQEIIEKSIKEYLKSSSLCTETTDINVEQATKSSLVVFVDDGYSVLAYSVYASFSASLYEFLIDTTTGDILKSYNLNITDIAVATGKNLDNETVKFDVYEENNKYFLEDAKRNISIYCANDESLQRKMRFSNEAGIVVSYDFAIQSWIDNDGNRITYNAETETYTNDNGVDFTSFFYGDVFFFGWEFSTVEKSIGISKPQSETLEWENSKEATLMYNLQKTYDYYLTAFNRSGYDNSNTTLTVVYDDHNNGDTTNAYSSTPFDGYPSMLSFGTNSTLEIDLIAHEYTHSVENSISNMIYDNESGAIMEGYSDLFGEIVEMYCKNGTCDWAHGKRTIYDPSVNGYPEKANDSANGYWKGDDGNYYSEDYNHGHSTVVSYAAYLMNNGINGKQKELSTKELANLWYNTLYMLPSNCTYMILREYMELTADNLGFTQEQKQCISAAFDEVGIESQDIEEKYSTESTLSVKDRNGDSYDDYTIKITGKKYRGFMKTGLWKEDYSDEISVSNSDPVPLNLTRGDYTITVTDNFDSSNSVSKSVKIRGGSKNKELLMATSFGFDYVINPSSQLTVYDMNNQLYDNYSVKIDGTYTDADNVKQSYSDNLTSNTSEPMGITINEGKYSFLLKDRLDESKTKNFTVRVRSAGSSDLKVYTAFGKKAGQYDKSDVPKDAVEYNGHYYYIYTDERSWYDADDFCKSQNGYLATITSSEEQQFVQQYMQKVKKSLTTNNNETWNKELWIGANDLNFEGIWEWSNGESFSYTNWGNNQPDDSGGQDYGALLSFLSEGSGYRINEGQWDDTDSYRCPFICEWGEYTPESAEKEISSQPKRETSDERDIVLVLDVSGSMSGTPLEETKKAATKFINTILKEDASIGIVVYDDNAEVLSDFSMDEEKLTGIVSGITDRGSTNIDDGLTKANELLQYSNAEKKIIVLMSDGMPNCGREGDDLIAFADSIKDTGTYIYTLGFFESVGGSKSSAQLLMEGIASDGCHYEVADADDLVFFFGDIADQINGQKFIYVRIACPVDVTVSYLGESLSSSEKDFNDRTSFGALSLEDIEDSDDKIKTLRLKEGKDYAIKINGTGRGKMDYTIGYMDDGGEYSDMRNFRNIDITRSTVIDTSTKYSDKTILNVDEDGDGKYDLKFRAGANEYGELVDYTYVIYIALCVIGAITVLIAVLVIRKKIKKRKAA